MKVLIVNRHVADVLGGSEMQCDIIAAGLTGRRHEITYAATSSESESDYRSYAYRVVSVNLRSRESIASVLRDVRPDIIYWRHNLLHFKAMLDEARRCGVPLVFAISHVNDTRRAPSFSRLAASVHPAKPLRSIAAVIGLYRYYLENGGLLNAVDGVTSLAEEFLANVPCSHRRVVRNAVPLEIEPFIWAKPYVLWVAGIKERKHPERYLALAELFAQRSDLDFLMMGEIQSDTYGYIHALSGKNFHYLGPKSPTLVNGALRNAECLVHTCDPEGFGNIFIQAWMQACPTITYSFDPDGLIQKHSLGFVSGSIDNMGRDLARLLDDQRLSAGIGERARRFALATFTPERLIDEIEQFLDETVLRCGGMSGSAVVIEKSSKFEAESC